MSTKYFPILNTQTNTIWPWDLVIVYGLPGFCFALFPQEPDRNLDFIEIFSGDQSVSTGIRLFGYHGQSVDARHGLHHDILEPSGFLKLLGLIWKVREFGLTFWAPPCSWWIWISRGTSKKSEACPKGDECNFKNKSQNRLVSRMCHLLWLCLHRRVFWIIEQPDSSVMSRYPRLARLLAAHRYVSAELSMGAYGGPTKKGTVLFGTSPNILSLAKTCSELDKQDIAASSSGICVTRYVVTTDNKRRSTGGPDLRQTQSYPIGFGAAVGRVFHELQSRIRNEGWTFATIDGKPPVNEELLLP